jgi:hypothetical protein
MNGGIHPAIITDYLIIIYAQVDYQVIDVAHWGRWPTDGQGAHLFYHHSPPMVFNLVGQAGLFNSFCDAYTGVCELFYGT